MLKIRFQRIGKKGHAHFRVVVTEHTVKPQGQYLELLGSYDPHKKELIVKADRINHWLAQGVQMSPTVNNLLINKKVLDGGKYKKVQTWKAKKTATSDVQKSATTTPAAV